MKKTQILMNELPYLGLSLLELSKNVMYEFWYGYIKPKYNEETKLYSVDTDSCIVHVKTEDIYKDILKDVEKRFGTSNYELERPLPTGKNKEFIGLMKDDQDDQVIRKELVQLGAKSGI